ncbi:hypothetical protein JTB14_005407 [Gonioctena quinquepunctata]|nr:hypothetical protein JTB14_005407 [Gonioctena quinquepunctata]
MDKLLYHTVVFNIYSYPHFAIETLLAVVLCIAHCLLIFEINNIYRRTNVKAAVKLRLKHPQLREGENCSCHTISRQHTKIFPKKIENTAIVPSHKSKKKLSTAPVIPANHGESRLMRRHGRGFNDKVDHLLSISPSQYVREDRERMHREAGLKSCIHSLTSLLEKALNEDNSIRESVSKESM